jgi:hypothetical protein
LLRGVRADAPGADHGRSAPLLRGAQRQIGGVEEILGRTKIR